MPRLPAILLFANPCCLARRLLSSCPAAMNTRRWIALRHSRRAGRRRGDTVRAARHRPPRGGRANSRSHWTAHRHRRRRARAAARPRHHSRGSYRRARRDDAVCRVPAHRPPRVASVAASRSRVDPRAGPDRLDHPHRPVAEQRAEHLRSPRRLRVDGEASRRHRGSLPRRGRHRHPPGPGGARRADLEIGADDDRRAQRLDAER